MRASLLSLACAGVLVAGPLGTDDLGDLVLVQAEIRVHPSRPAMPAEKPGDLLNRSLFQAISGIENALDQFVTNGTAESREMLAEALFGKATSRGMAGLAALAFNFSTDSEVSVQALTKAIGEAKASSENASAASGGKSRVEELVADFLVGVSLSLNRTTEEALEEFGKFMNVLPDGLQSMIRFYMPKVEYAWRKTSGEVGDLAVEVQRASGDFKAFCRAARGAEEHLSDLQVMYGRMRVELFWGTKKDLIERIKGAVWNLLPPEEAREYERAVVDMGDATIAAVRSIALGLEALVAGLKPALSTGLGCPFNATSEGT